MSVYPHDFQKSDSEKKQVPDFFAGKTDFDIWREFKSGNNSALTHLYRSHIQALYNYGCQFTCREEIVEDAIQELFVELMKNRKRLGETTSIKYYLFKSLRRKLVRHLKKEDRYIFNSENFIKENFEIEVSPELKLISDHDQDNWKQMLQEACNKLPVKQKEAVLLYFYEGMTYEQIASLMNMTKTKSARALIYRAIESLNKIINHPDTMISLLFLLSFWFLVN